MVVYSEIYKNNLTHIDKSNKSVMLISIKNSKETHQDICILNANLKFSTSFSSVNPQIQLI